MKRILSIFLFLILAFQVEGQSIKRANSFARAQVSAVITPPAFLTSDTYTEGWYIADVVADLTKTGGSPDYVTLWKDHLGSGNDLSYEAHNSYRPTWSSTGILFDGIDNQLNVALAIPQPYYIYAVMKEVTFASFRRIFVFNYVTGNFNYFVQLGSTPAVYAINGGLNIAGASSDNVWGIYRILYSGASSKFIYNANAPATGTLGTDAMAYFRISNEGSNGANIEVKEIIVRSVDDSGANETAVYNYLKAKYGL